MTPELSQEQSAALKALLDAPGLRSVLDAVARDGDAAWLVGGCVRNALLGEPLGDSDIATQAEPSQVMARAKQAGLKAVPTGIDHGTVTLVAEHSGFEVTTLRRDVATDGRRAFVAFTRDLAEDAARRDFTMNALYVDREGRLLDPLHGLADLDARRVRFIGEAGDRIAEDFLRILRFFRFYAWYGKGAPDREAMRAIVAGRDGMTSLSAERVWTELQKLLAAPHAARALLWMRQSGVYQIVLPESGDMDGFARFMRLEAELGLEPDALLRLLALLPLHALAPGRPDPVAALADRLKLSGAQRERLAKARSAALALSLDVMATPQALRVALYQHGTQSLRDGLVLLGVQAMDADPEAALPDRLVESLQAALAFARTWQAPRLPVSGRDLLDYGIPAGPQLGAALQLMEAAWVASDFLLGRKELLAVLKG
jgi:poly(A) polymerase